MSDQTNEAVWRKSARVYVASAVKLYLDIEAKVTLDNNESIGDAANIICSMARAMEHLLKLRLLRLDPVLLYPMPMSLEVYAAMKGISYHDNKVAPDTSELCTIGFSEALRRVAATTTNDQKSLLAFQKVRRLRDKLEHHWDNNVDYLAGIVGKMSSQVLPSVQTFISDILQEESSAYLDSTMLKDVERLDRALVEKHSLALQRRIDMISHDWQLNRNECAHLHLIPALYRNLDVVSIETKCPICGQTMWVRWALEDMEAYEVAPDGTQIPFIANGLPEPECVFCSQCGFYADGRDLTSYVPADFDYYRETVSADIFEQMQAEEELQQGEEENEDSCKQ